MSEYQGMPALSDLNDLPTLLRLLFPLTVLIILDLPFLSLEVSALAVEAKDPVREDGLRARLVVLDEDEFRGFDFFLEGLDAPPLRSSGEVKADTHR